MIFQFRFKTEIVSLTKLCSFNKQFIWTYGVVLHGIWMENEVYRVRSVSPYKIRVTPYQLFAKKRQVFLLTVLLFPRWTIMTANNVTVSCRRDGAIPPSDVITGGLLPLSTVVKAMVTDTFSWKIISLVREVEPAKQTWHGDITMITELYKKLA